MLSFPGKNPKLKQKCELLPNKTTQISKKSRNIHNFSRLAQSLNQYCYKFAFFFKLSLFRPHSSFLLSSISQLCGCGSKWPVKTHAPRTKKNDPQQLCTFVCMCVLCFLVRGTISIGKEWFHTRKQQASRD